MPGFMLISVVAPIVEELLKGLGLFMLFIFLKQRFENTLDGLVYGFAIGLGFALMENVIYFSNMLQTSRFTIESLFLTSSSMGQVFYTRSLFLATICHPAWTGLIGFGFGRMKELPNDRFKVLYPFVAIFLAMLLHSSWNAIGFYSPVTNVIEAIMIRLFSAGMLGGLLILLQVYWALHKEQTVVKEYLSDLVDPEIVTHDELSALSVFGRGYIHSFKHLLLNGWRSFYLTRSLSRLQVKLAFRRWYLSLNEAKGEVRRNDPEMQRIVRTIKYLRRIMEDQL